MSSDPPAHDAAAHPHTARPPPAAAMRALVWLFTIVAPGVLLLVMLIPTIPAVRLWLIGCVPVIVCLCTLWAALSLERLSVALGRGLAQLIGLYLATLAVDLFCGDRPLTNMPGGLALAEIFFVVPTLVAALAMRGFRWRLIRKPTGAEVLTPPARRWQFQLAEVFAWITITAVFLAAGTALIPRFDQEPVGWDGLGLAIILSGSAVLSVPTGILSVVFAWLILGQKRVLARSITALVTVLVWLLVWLGFALLYTPNPGADNVIFNLLVSLAIGVPLLIMLALARLTGWRLVRLPRPT